jgi:hypothetical protein
MGVMTDEYKLIQYQAHEWFRIDAGNNPGPWTIPVRDVACLFVPYEQRLEPETYKMLRFMHVFDLDQWCRHINMWLDDLNSRSLMVISISNQLTRLHYPLLPIGWSQAKMSDVVSTELCFTIQKTFLAADIHRSKYIQHHSLSTWDFEAYERQTSIVRVRQALIDAKDFDFYEDLKRWNEERQHRHYRYHAQTIIP